MLLILPRQRPLTLAVLLCLATSCQNNSDISSAGGTPGRPTNSSGGLVPVGGNDPDAASHAPDPPSGIKPWPDGGPPDVAPVKDEKCAAQSQAAKQVPVDLLLLVDRSGSMTYKVSGDA